MAWSKEVLSKNLRYYMESRGKNQKEMAEIVGVSAPTMNDWLKGKKYPRIDKIEILANYFGILKSDLIEDRKEQPTDNDGLSEKQKAFFDKVMQMSDAELDRLDKILSLVENTK